MFQIDWENQSNFKGILKREDKDIINRGFERCSKLGTDPFDGKCRNVYSGLAFKKIYTENINLIKHAMIFMEELYSVVKGSNFVVDLTDKRGIVLEMLGDSPMVKKFNEEFNFRQGSYFEERYVGNTAINTAIYEGKPVQICGDDYYCNIYRVLACSSAPIYSGDEIIGIINVSGLKNMVHPHTLGMVVSAAKAITTKIETDRINHELVVQNKYKNAIVESISDGLLTVDRDGYLTFINEVGADILRIDRKASIGKHITEVVDFKPVVLEVLKTGVGYFDREFIITNKAGHKMHFIKTAQPIRDENGNMLGIVDTFKKINLVQKMVNDMVGAYANFTFEDIIGGDEKFSESLRIANIAANSSSNVLIMGESGTGKELYAHAIHNASKRRKKPFISINCAAIPRELLESELFGYEGGAFTGALKNGRPGKFELANGGSIFLDEIGDMPLDMQAKLLRVLQEKKISRIGGSNIFEVDVRIIAATNKNLHYECNRGAFRKDLYYRLNVLNIQLPPLRDRKEDIEKLVNHFIKKLNAKLNKKVTGITSDAMEILKNYNWPGNIRELENIIERAINICEGINISIFELPGEITCAKANKKLSEEHSDDIKFESLEEMEKKCIMNAIAKCSGNISQAADILKVSRNTIYNKMKKYGFEVI